ncbi:hypothetical protein [Cupriavidus sp. Marseille-Q8015]
MKERARVGESIGQYIDGYLTEHHRDDPGTGCPMTALAAEIAREPAAQPVFTRHVVSMLEALSAPVAKGRKKRTRRDAIHTLASMVGAVILARAVDDTDISDEILREVREALT